MIVIKVMQTIRYEGQIPVRLRQFCDNNRHKVVEVIHGGGYATDSGEAYDVALRRGWKDGSDALGTTHSIIATSYMEMIAAIKGAIPCDCEDCKPKPRKNLFSSRF